MKIAFLDRDGTIVKDYPDEEWRDKRIPEVLEGAIEGMLLLNTLGYKIIIVTNQYLINDGIITLDDYRQFTNHLMDIFKVAGVKILDVFYCPHSASEGCACKKPEVGLIQMALEKYPEIVLGTSIMIGDSDADEGLAFNLGLDFYRVNGHSGQESIIDVLINNSGKL